MSAKDDEVWEYGIWHIRENCIHRDRMSKEQAEAWMSPSDWEGLDVSKVFKIVKRPIPKWTDA